MQLKDRSTLFIDDRELQSLETSARRMRGEIFFAERWLIVEGQSDYLIVYGIAFALGYDLDRHGVAVIDAQNNGSPAMFAVLARALNIPWLAVFDGDQAGQTYKRQIAERGFNADEINYRIHLHSENDLETQLVADGLNTELRAILETLGERNADSLNDKDLIERLQNSKTRYAPALAEQLRSNVDLAQRSPEAFRNAIGKLRGLE